MRVVLIGFGNLGRKLAAILTRERDRFPGAAGLDLCVVALLTRSRGALVNPKGIPLSSALEEIERRGSWASANPDFASVNGMEAAQGLDYDVLVELSTLSIQQQGQPALGHVLQALERGRHVVTANKGPSAFAHRRIAELARRRGVLYLHESTVMDGAPIFNMARSGLRGCTVTGFSGIVNSTTHYVLSQMESGRSLQEAVSQAQQMGFAEADPRHDLQGWDAAAKLCVLANALMGAEITPLQVERTEVDEAAGQAVRQALRSGRRLKPIIRAQRREGRLQGRVCLESFPENHPWAVLSGAANLLRLETDWMGPIHIVQEAPTLYDTAYGVLNDLLEAAERISRKDVGDLRL